MKKKIISTTKILTTVAVVAIVASCTKELAPDPADIIIKHQISATVNMPKHNPNKAYLHTSVNKVYWQSGDAISINGTNIVTNSIDKNDSTKAEFAGSVNANFHESKDCYWAVYPTSIRNSESSSLLTITLPNTQTYNSSKPLSGTTYMAAHTDVTSGTNEVSLNMKNLVTIIKLNLQSSASNKKLSQIVVSHTALNLCGTFTTSAPTTNISSSSGQKTIIVNCTDGTNDYIDISSAKDVYIALPPLANSGTLIIKMYNTDDDYTIKTLDMTSTSLSRNTVYTSTISGVAFGDKKAFSVSASQTVVFSSGNLQYKACNSTPGDLSHATAEGTANGQFRFATNQYDYVGNNSTGTVYENAVKCNNILISSSYTGWIDVFGWGTSGWNNGNLHYQPYDSDTTTSGSVRGKYSGYGYGPYNGVKYGHSLIGIYDNADWGVYNAICSTSVGTWRTLTKDEWIWLLGPTSSPNPGTNCRESSTVNGTENARYAKATVADVKGLIIFPDSYSHPSGPSAPTSINTTNANFNSNTYDVAAWTLMEAAGCVFLPSAGYRLNGNSYSSSGSVGHYWTSS
ncbi:MAG: hypothetical protein J5605_05500, partial [Bacteroidales bacterium]|nr:hypothetical protein [Bacteroidales bacterium]